MIPEDVKLAAGAVVLPLVNKLTVAETDALFTDIINAIMSDRASRLTRPDTETIRKAALEERRARARNLMAGFTDLTDDEWTWLLYSLPDETVQQLRALVAQYDARALSQKGDEADG